MKQLLFLGLLVTHIFVTYTADTHDSQKPTEHRSHHTVTNEQRSQIIKEYKASEQFAEDKRDVSPTTRHRIKQQGVEEYRKSDEYKGIVAAARAEPSQTQKEVIIEEYRKNLTLDSLPADLKAAILSDAQQKAEAETKDAQEVRFKKRLNYAAKTAVLVTAGTSVAVAAVVGVRYFWNHKQTAITH